MTETLDEVYSLLIPVAGAKLLLPRLAVAEVTGFTRLEPIGGDTPAWLLGRMAWHGETIPVVSFEGFCDRPVPEVTHRARLAVMHGINGRLPEKVFGLMIQGYPYLVRVNANVIKAADGDDPPWEGPVFARPRMANEKPMIPNLIAVEEAIANALEAQPAVAEA